MPVCPQLRWFQNASIRGPSSHMQTPQANVSCHVLRSLGRQSRGWWPVQGAHSASLCFSQSCSALLGFVLHAAFMVIIKPLGKGILCSHSARERSAALLQLSNGSASSWSACARFHLWSLAPETITRYYEMFEADFLNSSKSSQGDSTAMLGYDGGWCQHSLNPLAVSKDGYSNKTKFLVRRREERMGTYDVEVSWKISSRKT